MAATKNILVVCGTAIATSTIVAKSLEAALADRGIRAYIKQCKASEAPSQAAGMDLIVTTTPLPSGLGVPVVRTLAFLTGVGKDKALAEILSHLQE